MKGWVVRSKSRRGKNFTAGVWLISESLPASKDKVFSQRDKRRRREVSPMAQQIRLEIVTPAGAVVNEDVDIVNAPGYGGDFGVLAHHAPFLSTVKIGVLSYERERKRENLMISGGFCEVSNNKITFLVESAEPGREIDVDRAMKARERAEKRLAQSLQHDEALNLARAEAALQKALARLKVAKSI